MTGIHRLSEDRLALLQSFSREERTALARIISVVENERSGHQAVLHELHGRLGHAHRIGITGPPGAGKSTLTAELIRRLRARDQSVGVVAVDPTSPFTGGALLGDRIRMNDVAHDPHVFVRSMATRGSLGGLAVTTKEVTDVMDAFGFDRVLVETVGVGQSELDIAAAADTTVVVLVPESGDSIQTMKAGLMEAADLFVVNKADRPGAERLAQEVQMMLQIRLGDRAPARTGHHGVDLGHARKAGKGQARGQGQGGHGEGGGTARNEADASDSGGRRSAVGGRDSWTIPVIQTIADTGEGVDELLEALDRHLAWLQTSGELSRRRKQRLAERVRDVVRRQLLALAWSEHDGRAILQEALPALEAGDTTPYEVASRIVNRIRG